MLSGFYLQYANTVVTEHTFAKEGLSRCRTQLYVQDLNSEHKALMDYS